MTSLNKENTKILFTLHFPTLSFGQDSHPDWQPMHTSHLRSHGLYLNLHLHPIGSADKYNYLHTSF